MIDHAGEPHHEGAVQSIPYLTIAIPLAVGFARGLYIEFKERREARRQADQARKDGGQ